MGPQRPEFQILIEAIDFCSQHQLITPCLILVYSTMDIMAWLDRKRNHVDVKVDDFIRWVNTYLLPGSSLPCTAIDLYAARCGLLHSYSPESKLSREGKAVEIYYAYGSRSEDDLQKVIDAEGRNARAIHVDRLVAALKRAIEDFWTTIELDPTRDALISTRFKRMFSHVLLQ